MIEINRQPSRRDLRIFALGVTILLGLLGFWLRRRFGWDAAVPLALVCGAVVAGLGVTHPQLLRPVYVGWMVALSPVSWLVSYVLLGIVYYGVVTPLGLLLRCLGRDPLERRFDRQAPSYWKRRGDNPNPESYFRTF